MEQQQQRRRFAREWHERLLAPLSDKRRALAASRRAEVAVARQLHVRIMRASGLKSVQVFGAQDPYVKVRVFDLRPFPDMPY